MAGILTWTDRAQYEEGYRIYRSLSPINPANPGFPIALIPPNSTVFADFSTSVHDTETTRQVYYLVEAYRGHLRASTPVVQTAMSLHDLYRALGYAAYADFRRGVYGLPEIGPDLLAGVGSFDDASAWTVGPDWTIVDGAATKVSGDTFQDITRPLLITSGRVHQIQFTVSGYVSGSVRCALIGGTTATFGNVTANGTYTQFVLAEPGNNTFQIRGTASFVGSVDNITVREVLDTSRPATEAEWRATFTASTSRTRVNASGQLVSFAPDTFGFDFTNGHRQLRLENSSTNSIANSTFTGTTNLSNSGLSVINAQGLTTSVIATGTEDGIAYADLQIAGTPTTGLYQIAFNGISVAAEINQSWTFSAFMRIINGSFENTSDTRIRIAEEQGGAFLVASNADITPTTSPLRTQRFSVSRTLSNASTSNIRARFSMNVTLDQPVNVTIRIGLPQLERSPFPTSPILTTGTAVTRAVESFRLPPQVEQLLRRPAVTAVVKGQGIRGSAGRILGGSSTMRWMGLNMAETQIGMGSTAYSMLAGVTVPLPSFGIAVANDPSGKHGSYQGATVLSNAIEIETREPPMWLGRDSNSQYASGHYDFFGVVAGRPSNDRLRFYSRPYE